jgi:hypothetical protein
MVPGVLPWVKKELLTAQPAANREAKKSESL